MSGSAFPPPGLVTVSKQLPAFLFEEYSDDANMQAFFAAFNVETQNYLDWFNQINLPIYTQPQIVGSLLDWVGEGLYGIKRPALASGSIVSVGLLDTWAPDTLAPDDSYSTGAINLFVATDDIYKRVITWHFFKGDGQQFCIEYLKRRVVRFLLGLNGTAPNIGETYQISVVYTSRFAITITVTLEVTGLITLTNAQIFQAAIQSNVLALPLQLTCTVVIVNNLGPTGLLNTGGVLTLTDSTGWPTSAVGLVAGSLWDAGGGAIYCVPTTMPDPFAAPVMYGLITGAALLAIGGSNLPLVDPVNSGQIWNNAGVICVSLGL